MRHAVYLSLLVLVTLSFIARQIAPVKAADRPPVAEGHAAAAPSDPADAVRPDVPATGLGSSDSAAGDGGAGLPATARAAGAGRLSPTGHGAAGSQTFGALAVNFLVNNTTDAVDFAPGDGVCETATGNNVCTLRAAIQETNALVGADTITVPAGTYSIAIAGRGELEGAQGDLNVKDDLTITGAGPGVGGTIVSGGNIDRVFNIDDGKAVSISDLAIQDGNTGFNNTVGNGAGINNLGSLTLTGVVVRNNHAVGNVPDGFGFSGGINSFEGTLTLTDSSVVDNTADANCGGIGQNGNGSVTTLSNSSIATNHALGIAANASGSGGGMCSGSTGSTAIIVNGGSVTGNTAAGSGGGIAAFGGTTLTMSGATISNNSTPSGGTVNKQGGGIFVVNGATMALTNTTVSGNSTGRQGGGIYHVGSGGTITGGTITGNSTPLGTTNDRDGGGIYNASPGSLTLTNVAVTNNVSGREGGGILNNSTLTINGGSVTGNSILPDPTDLDPNNRNGGGVRHFTGSTTTINNATISSNTAVRSGGGVAGSGNAQLTNTTVTLNQAGTNGGGLNGFSGIVNGVQSTLIVNGGTISQNTAGGTGGGIVGSSTTEITGTTVSNNQAGTVTASTGGGIASFATSTAGVTTRLTLTNVIVSGNSATQAGGGVGGSGSLTINTYSITGNQAGTSGIGGGGGIFAGVATVTGVTSRLIVHGGTVSQNASTSSGGGITAFGSDLEISGTTIEYNSSPNGGGGIARGFSTFTNMSGTFSHAGTATIANALIRGNHATGSSSGGGLTASAGTTTITGSTIENNDAGGNGGAIGNFNGSGTATGQTSTLLISNSVIRTNTAAQNGGGITQGANAGSPPPSVSLTDTTVSGNTATASTGGGISSGSGTVTLLRTTFTGNSSATGGGGVLISAPAATLNATSSTFSSNTTAQNGGGIHSSGISTVTNVTFHGNQAAGGGAIRVFSGTTTVRNSIMANSTGGNCLGAITSQGNNLEFPGNTCSLNPGLGDILNANPLLGALANNGGPTLTHLPAAGSPVIDAGSNAVCGKLDQRLGGRPLDGNGDGNNVCDIGSVEASTRPFVACGTRPNVSAAPAPGSPGRIQATITAQGANNQIHSLRIVISPQIAPNFVVDIVGGPQDVTGPIVYVAPPGTVQVGLFIERINPGAATVPMVVTDSCSEWQTFVGGGTRAFQ